MAEAISEALTHAAGVRTGAQRLRRVRRPPPRRPEGLLSLVAFRAWQSTLVGRRVLCPVYTDDPNLDRTHIVGGGERQNEGGDPQHGDDGDGQALGQHDRAVGKLVGATDSTVPPRAIEDPSHC